MFGQVQGQVLSGGYIREQSSSGTAGGIFPDFEGQPPPPCGYLSGAATFPVYSISYVRCLNQKVKSLKKSNNLGTELSKKSSFILLYKKAVSLISWIASTAHSDNNNNRSI